MSFPRYPTYKESGVEWLGEVPEHWEVLPCRGIVQERAGRNDGAECQDYLSLMANVGVIPYADKGDVGNKKPEDLSKCKIVTRGDFVINSMNYGIGSYGLSDYDGVCSPVYIVLKPQNDVVESRFAFRIFENKAFQTFAQSFGNGILAHRCSINWDILKSIGVGVPPADEQTAILGFLDRETAKIDGLVAEQRRLMELLKEKRQAVISHAVTKGLKPDAPMKPSGIEWLGEVPEHWEVKRTKHVVLEDHGIQMGPFGGMLLGLETEDTGFKVYGQENTISGDFTRGNRWLSEDRFFELSSYHVAMGDLLLTRKGSIGNARLVQSLPQPGIVDSDTIRVRINERLILPPFLARLFHEAGYITEQLNLAKRGAILPGLNSTTIANISIILPSVAEQREVLGFIDSELTKFDTLTAEAQRAIDLLQERRTALISAAVTGQIDVRQLATREDAA